MKNEEKILKGLEELEKFYRENPSGSLRYYVEADLKELRTNPESDRSKEIIEEYENGTYLE